MATVYQITNVNVTIDWNGEPYPLGQIDSLTISSSLNAGVTFGADRRFGAFSVPIKTLSGGASPDMFSFSTTVLPKGISDTLKAFFKAKADEYLIITVSLQEDPNMQYVLESAVVTSPLYQTSIDDMGGSKYSFEFVGQLTRMDEGNI